ncbi:MAG: BatA domain-containing protein [Candidatus Poribacteria bacterium]|nr:BatA domain-containing protein [Candidatus Poribacteria bacterium]
MNFLQPLALIALPLVALPIIIHLINQHRHRTIPWAAMMFLMTAKRMSKGMARLRHFFILLMRVLAIAALIFVVSRPLSGGWLGSIGLGKPDATLILLDRSPSMEMQDLQVGQSKRSMALQKLAELLEQGDYGTHLVLIDSATGQLQEVDSPKALLNLPMTESTATSADIPAMLETALAYLKANESGRADLWFCSDLNENDWDVDSGRWNAIREEFAQLEGIHHFLLAYTDSPSGNLSVRVENVQRWTRGNDAELILDVVVRATDNSGGTRQGVPIEFEVNNVRSVVEVDIDRQGASLRGHRIPIDAKLSSGWGSVGLPGDANPLDNRFFFVFSESPVRKAVVVSDNAKIGEAFRRALAIPPDPRLQHQTTVISVDRIAEIDWENTSLLIWQAALPHGLVASQIEQFVDAGRVVMFFPPSQSASEELFASRWGNWQTPENSRQRSAVSSQQEDSGLSGNLLADSRQPTADSHSFKISWWRGDTDLLAHVESGDALPLNQLLTYRYRAFESTGTPLARFQDEASLLTRVATDQGAVYFCSTLPTAQFSSLEREGVVFYVMLQRALAEGSRSLAVASQRNAGPDVLADRNQWQPVAPTDDAPPLSQSGLHAGVYRDGEYWAAVNRSQVEDMAQTVPVATVDALFDGISYRRIDADVGDTSALASELWRIFLIAMAVALVAEAVLSLPNRRSGSLQTK